MSEKLPGWREFSLAFVLTMLLIGCTPEPGVTSVVMPTVIANATPDMNSVVVTDELYPIEAHPDVMEIQTQCRALLNRKIYDMDVMACIAITPYQDRYVWAGMTDGDILPGSALSVDEYTAIPNSEGTNTYSILFRGNIGTDGEISIVGNPISGERDVTTFLLHSGTVTLGMIDVVELYGKEFLLFGGIKTESEPRPSNQSGYVGEVF